jgi:hypothetical protein
MVALMAMNFPELMCSGIDKCRFLLLDEGAQYSSNEWVQTMIQ